MDEMNWSRSGRQSSASPRGSISSESFSTQSLPAVSSRTGPQQERQRIKWRWTRTLSRIEEVTDTEPTLTWSARLLQATTRSVSLCSRGQLNPRQIRSRRGKIIPLDSENDNKKKYFQQWNSNSCVNGMERNKDGKMTNNYVGKKTE